MASLSLTCSNTTMNMCLIFPPKTARDPCQHDMVANFWAASTAWFQDGTEPHSEWLTLHLPLSDFLLVLYGKILHDHFQALVTCWKTTLKARVIDHNFLSNSLWGARQSRWRPNSEKRAQSLELPPSLAAFTLITEPNAHGLHDLECLMTFLQNFSTVAIS